MADVSKWYPDGNQIAFCLCGKGTVGCGRLHWSMEKEATV